MELSVNWITETIKSFIGTNEFIKDQTTAHVATLLCSASIGSSVGYQLYQKYKSNAKYQCHSQSRFNYNDYKRILTASAPGKVILCGEHAVVYDKCAISTAIDKRTYISIFEPMHIHRVINLCSKPLHHNNQSPTNSVLSLRLNQATLSWKICDLIAVHNLNENKWDPQLISNQYHLLKPFISFSPLFNKSSSEKYSKHPLYGQCDWDKQISSVLLLLLFQCFSKLFNDRIFISYGIVIECKSDIPIGAGLGSSAAWSTSLCAALYYYWLYVTAGQRKTKVCSNGVQTISRIWKLAYESEKIHHGTPSGIDNTTSVYGGYVKFRNKEQFTVIDVEKQCVNKLPLMVINSQIIGNTKKLVHGVKKLKKRESEIVNGIFESIERIGESMLKVLMDDDIKNEELCKSVDDLFCFNHGLLNSLGVGHAVIERIKCICDEYKMGKGFKITGAGGGGSVIVSLLNKEQSVIDRLRKTLKSNGYESYLIQTGQQGLSCKFH